MIRLQTKAPSAAAAAALLDWHCLLRQRIILLIAICAVISNTNPTTTLLHVPVVDARTCVAAAAGNTGANSNDNNANNNNPKHNIQHNGDQQHFQHQCTDDPLLLTRAINHNREPTNRYHLGLGQRIDGTESEKKAVVEVLKRMDHYFVNEVLAHPEYASVRHRCQNLNELCAFWVAVGECESNRIFMLSNCAAACRFCLLLNTDIQ